MVPVFEISKPAPVTNILQYSTPQFLIFPRQAPPGDHVFKFLRLMREFLLQFATLGLGVNRKII